jgi:hypothetical protein
VLTWLKMLDFGFMHGGAVSAFVFAPLSQRHINEHP